MIFLRPSIESGIFKRGYSNLSLSRELCFREGFMQIWGDIVMANNRSRIFYAASTNRGSSLHEDATKKTRLPS
jgi:hypothetical protein